MPDLTSTPVEKYPGELEHLRSLLSDVQHAVPSDDPDATSPLTQILIDHYSDSRIVDAQFDAQPALCPCGQPVPEGRIAYCSDACRLADKDHGPDSDGVGGDES